MPKHKTRKPIMKQINFQITLGQKRRIGRYARKNFMSIPQYAKNRTLHQHLPRIIAQSSNQYILIRSLLEKSQERINYIAKGEANKITILKELFKIANKKGIQENDLNVLQQKISNHYNHINNQLVSISQILRLAYSAQSTLINHQGYRPNKPGHTSNNH